MHDVRAIANFVLDLASETQVKVTNLSLNKIVYFLHAENLAQGKGPLIRAKIEAWQYGPVFRELYSSFKQYGPKPISSRAERINKISGEREVCALDIEEQTRNELIETCKLYFDFSASQLVSLSHAKGGPWDRAFNHDGRSNPGMVITDDEIKRFHAPKAVH